MIKGEKLSATRRGFRFEWYGGEYLEIFGAGVDIPFEVINMSTAEGNDKLPPFTSEVFLAKIDALEPEYFAALRHTYRESRR